ncbi:MAG: Swt1 family HEPN domain-containing protein [Cellvibrionaceae bacterium]|nr:Swt1 family HEPN domain-containing protein [Cellvibrionaceae bacterium]
MSENLKEVRDWMFRALLFEAEAEEFRAAGIKIGANQAEAEKSLLEETIAPFSLTLRNEGLMMARIYTLMYCFENSVRELIRDRLQEKHGGAWWENSVPKKVQGFAENRQKSAEKESWLEGQKSDLLSFVDFGHLSDIIANNWDDFSDLIPSQHWLRQRMDELEKARNFIAHHRLLLPSEFQRIEMYINDWNRVVGL